MKTKLYPKLLIGATFVALGWASLQREDVYQLFDPRFIELPRGSTSVKVDGKPATLDKFNTIKIGVGGAERPVEVTFRANNKDYRFATVFRPDDSNFSIIVKQDSVCASTDSESSLFVNGKRI